MSIAYEYIMRMSIFSKKIFMVVSVESVENVCENSILTPYLLYLSNQKVSYLVCSLSFDNLRCLSVMRLILECTYILECLHVFLKVVPK